MLVSRFRCGWFTLFGGALLALAIHADDSAPRTGPFSPDDALRLFKIHPDFQIQLAASEPDVLDPVHIAFDDRARMWVIEYSDYPNGPAEGQPGTCSVKILTDDDGDGRYTNAKVFADKLLFATGLLPWKDGIILTTAGNVLFLRDTDGDGRADETQEWFAGFREENPQLRANHPTFALDNHIYIASGIRGGNVVPGKDWAKAFGRTAEEQNAMPVSLSGRDFRFNPLNGNYEVITGPSQFGLSFDDWGSRYLCDNRHPCKHVILEERDLQRNPNVTATQTFEDIVPAGEDSRLFPISRTWTTSNLHANQFTAACGVTIVRGTALPPEAYGNALTCEPTANLVHRAILKPKGATFTSKRDREGVEFLATTDEWFRPVNMTVGPDGALYIVDMYRAVIEHPQFMPEELKNRPDLLLGMDKGRIYRITAKNGSNWKAPVKSPLPAQDGNLEQTFELLKSANSWQRDAAQKALLVSDIAAIADKLDALAGTPDSPGSIEALRLLAAQGKVSPERVLAAVKSSNAGLVIAAAQIAEAKFAGHAGIGKAVYDAIQKAPADRRKFQLYLSLKSFPNVPEVKAAPGVFGTTTDIADPWLRKAIQLGAPHGIAPLVPGCLTLAATTSSDSTAKLAALLELSETVGRGNDESELKTLLGLVTAHSRGVSEEHREQYRKPLFVLLKGLAQGLRSRGVNPAQRLNAIKDEQGVPLIQPILDDAVALVQNGGDLRHRAIELLSLGSSEVSTPVLLDVLHGSRDQAILTTTITSLAAFPSDETTAALLENFSAHTPVIQASILGTLARTTAGLKALVDELENGNISPRLIDAARVRQLTGHKDPAIGPRAQKIFAALTPADRQKVIADYQAALTLKANPVAGREVFEKNCTTCHKIGDLGVNVAPDISDSRTKTVDYLLTAILDPNRAIDNNYFAYTIVDADGVVHSGVVATETATSVTLVQPGGKQVTILRDQIEEMRSTGISLMPEGLERNMTPQQIADLISFIKNWRYLDGSVPQEVIR